MFENQAKLVFPQLMFFFIRRCSIDCKLSYFKYISKFLKISDYCKMKRNLDPSYAYISIKRTFMRIYFCYFDRSDAKQDSFFDYHCNCCNVSLETKRDSTKQTNSILIFLILSEFGCNWSSVFNTLSSDSQCFTSWISTWKVYQSWLVIILWLEMVNF